MSKFRLSDLIFFIGILIFFKFFYNSFLFGEDIFLFDYKVSNLEFVISFYILLFFSIYNFFEKINLDFVFTQLLISTSLLIIGEYTYFIVLQFIFLFVSFNAKNRLVRKMFFAIYLLALHKVLLLVFSSFYLLYFFNLALLIHMFFAKRDYIDRLNTNDVLLFVMVLILVISILFGLEDLIFDLYIWLGVVDTHIYQVSFVVYILSIVHILILIFILFIQRKLLNFKLY